MLVSSLTAAGTIREQNQDCILLNRDARLVLLADGTGPDGSNAASSVLQKVSAEILENAHVYAGGEEACRRMVEAFKKIQPGLHGAVAGFAGVWIHRGKVAVVWQGSCRALANHNFIGTPDQDDESLKSAIFNAGESDRYILLSEGVEAALKDNYLHNLLSDLRVNFSGERLQFFWNETAVRYDGDDRSIVSICLEKSDLCAGNPKELVLFTDFDRQFAIPLWLPASISALLSLIGLFLAKKVFTRLRSLQPQLKEKAALLKTFPFNKL